MPLYAIRKAQGIDQARAAALRRFVLLLLLRQQIVMQRRFILVHSVAYLRGLVRGPPFGRTAMIFCNYFGIIFSAV